MEQDNTKAAQGPMLKRPGRAGEVAAAILFLASDDASRRTASTIAGPPCNGPGRFRSWRVLNRKAGRWRVDRP
jgi:NAD(P)-dependent dehydrogenase (short-subunit alcohol dehydrogenase family)